MKNVFVLALFLASLAAFAQTKPAASSAAPNASFRERAEDVLDCLDSADIVATRADPVFYPQALQCRPMLRRLGRTAASEQEKATVDALLEYQRKITACHIVGGACQETDARTKAIEVGQLRAPAAAGQ